MVPSKTLCMDPFHLFYNSTCNNNNNNNKNNSNDVNNSSNNNNNSNKISNIVGCSKYLMLYKKVLFVRG